MSPQVSRRQVDDQQDQDILQSNSERDKLINQLMSLRVILLCIHVFSHVLYHCHTSSCTCMDMCENTWYFACKMPNDLKLLKTESSLLKQPSVISSKLSSSVQSLTNSMIPEPLLVEVKPIQGQHTQCNLIYCSIVYLCCSSC